MKVLALVPDFIDKPSGGLGEQFRHLINHLEGRVDYYVAGYPETNSLKNFKAAMLPIPIFKHASLNTIYGQSIYFLKALEFKEEFDVIHAFDWSTFYAGYLCKQHFKKPLVCSVNLSVEQLNENGIFYCHDPNTVDGIHINQLQRYFEEMGFVYGDKVIQVSEYYNSLFPDYVQKSVVISNGIEPSSWVKKRTPKLPGKNKLKFCYIGRPSPMKGLDVILNCEIPNDIDLYFVVSPKNAEEPIFTNIKKKCNNVNIFHIPGLYNQDKVDFLYAMDGIIMPSKHEPFGIVALEALISENLFVTTASGGIQEIVEGTDYFKISSSEDLLQTFKKIQTLTSDQIKQITEKGKQRALSFTWSNAANQYYDVYQELTAQKQTLEWY